MKKTKTSEDNTAASIKINRSRGSGKKRADLFARLRNTEHPLDNIFPDKTPEIFETELNPTLPHPTVVETTTPQATLPEATAVSPSKNFTKFSNSLLKQAIPGGMFRGQSKHTYDVLYLRTRGAVNPTREIQLTKVELVKLTGLEIKTIQRHLSFLRGAGLISVDPKIGDHKGAVYAVNIPEEMTQPNPTLVQYGVVETTLGKTGVIPTPNPSINSTTVGLSKSFENKELNASPNTSLKTNTNDDEAFVDFIENFQAAAISLTGKKLARKDAANLKDLSELLILELKIAASRTGGVSSVPAFLTEVLRRHIVASRQQQSSAKVSKTSAKADTVGKSESETLEIKALDEKGREAALVQLQEFAGDDFLEDFKKWYTPEDWDWLISEIKKAEKNEK